jgi:hypothetical protein
MRLLVIAARTLVVGSVVVSCERGTVEATTCNLNAIRVADSSIGPLYVGEALPALRVRCPSVHDTLAAEPGSAGSSPALRLIVAGAPVIVRHNGATVTALHVQSPFFRTNDSLGVGTSVAAFRNVRGIRVSRAGATPYAVLLDRRHCGVAWELSGWGPDSLPAVGEPPLSGAVLARWPDAIVVRAVTVSGCRGVTGDLGVDSIAEAPADTAPTLIDSAVAPIPPLAVRTLPMKPTPIAKIDTVSVSTKSATSATPATSTELAELRAELIIPVRGVTPSQLRDTYSESRSTGRLHEAIDILAPRGTPVVSASDGRLLKLFTSKAGGFMVYASDLSDRFILLYAHLDRYADGLREGMQLARGQVIGYVGTTGNAPANTPHLHFGILRGRPSVAWWKGTAINPYPVLVVAKPAP